MYSGSWFFDAGGGMNDTEFRIWDPDDDEVLLASGENEFSLKNIGIGIAPEYYLLPGKRVNPFFFAGISVNFTFNHLEDNEWAALKELGLLDPPDDPPERASIESNLGHGFYFGAGVDFSLGDQLSLFLLSTAHLVHLREKNFYTPEQHENLDALCFQGGVRMSLLKSKEL
jgi:hypothetical protein